MKPQFVDISLSSIKTVRIKKIDTFYLESAFHFHHLCELVWIEKGYGKRIVGDRVANFEEGDLVLMGPNLPHIWQNDEIFHKKTEGNHVKATVVYFHPEFLLNLTDEEGILNPAQELLKRSARGLHFNGNTYKKVSAILSNISEKQGFAKIIDFLQLIDLLAASGEYNYLSSIAFKNLFNEKDTNRINEVYKFLMLNFHRDINLKEVSDLCNMTIYSFCRYFKSRTQKPFTKFLNEIRIGHACKLILNEDYSINDVCYECGYNNLANFHKFFKAITGKTPSQYKRELKVNNSLIR